MIDEIDRVTEYVNNLRAKRPTPAFIGALNRLEELRGRKISDLDRSYIGEISDLLSARDSIIDGRRANAAAGAAIAVAFLAALRAVIGAANADDDAVWAFMNVIPIVLAALFLAARTGALSIVMTSMREEHLMMTRGGPTSFLITIGGAMCAVGLAAIMEMMPPELIRVVGLAFPISGAPLGALVADALHFLRLSRNMDEIISICGAYSYSSGGSP